MENEDPSMTRLTCDGCDVELDCDELNQRDDRWYCDRCAEEIRARLAGDEANWDQALARIDRLLEQSAKVASMFSNVFTGYYDAQLRVFKARYEKGDRSQGLYEDIMNYSE